MVRNRATNDEGFVPPIQYPKLSRQMKKKPLPAPRTQLFNELGSGHPSTDESIYARDKELWPTGDSLGLKDHFA